VFVLKKISKFLNHLFSYIYN